MSKLLDKVIHAIGILLRILLLVSVVLIIGQVFFRYVLKHPLMWTEQVCRMMFIWMMMLGIPVLFHEKNTMAFDMLLEKFPPKLQQITQIFINLSVAAFSAFWVYGTVTLILGTYKKMTSGVRVPYAFLYAAQAVGALLLLWVMIDQTIPLIRGLRKGKGGTDA